MNKSRGPGIITESILLIDADFKRHAIPPKNVQTQVQLSYDGSCVSETHAQGTMKVNVKGTNKHESSDEEVFTAKLTFVGVFRQDTKNPNMELGVFIKNHAPGHMFPYVREFVTSLSYRSGLPVIILPPVNMAALMQIDMEADLTDSSIVAEIQKQETE